MKKMEKEIKSVFEKLSRLEEERLHHIRQINILRQERIRKENEVSQQIRDISNAMSKLIDTLTDEECHYKDHIFFLSEEEKNFIDAYCLRHNRKHNIYQTSYQGFKIISEEGQENGNIRLVNAWTLKNPPF